MVDYCGALTLPVHGTYEMVPPAKVYQHCLPNVLQYLSSVTNTQHENANGLNFTPPGVADLWETIHIETADAEWEAERELFQSFGLTTFVGAQDVRELLPSHPEYDYYHGYYDDRGIEFFWQFVDNVTLQQPHKRMYLSWMSTTTHTPFLLSEEWLAQNYQPFVQDYDFWGSTDKWLNAIRFTDDKLKEFILGFRERGLENETLFIMYFLP